MSNREATPATMDRRANNRMPIEQEIRYKLFGDRKTKTQIGSGKTLNMSSSGVLFTTESGLPEGMRVQLEVSWPARLDGVTPLKLVAIGVLVRAGERQAALSIQKHEFKTRGSGAGMRLEAT